MSKAAASAVSRLYPILPSHIASPSAQQVSIRRVPGIPFFRDDGHTRPTLALYRRLLRSSSHKRSTSRPNEARTIHAHENVDWAAIRRMITHDWKRRKGLTSIPQTRAFLESQYVLLDTILHTDDDELLGLSRRSQCRQERLDDSLTPEPTRQPFIAGYLRPAFTHHPLPRLKPQPVQMTLMIKSRVAARERRVKEQKRLKSQEAEIKEEIAFARRARSRESLEEAKVMLGELRSRQAELQVQFDRSEKRRMGVFPVGMVERVERAKQRRREFKRRRAEERKRQSANGQQESTGAVTIE